MSKLLCLSLVTLLIFANILLPTTRVPRHLHHHVHVASALCGAAGSLGMLIVARILQGAGGGALRTRGVSVQTCTHETGRSADALS